MDMIWHDMIFIFFESEDLRSIKDIQRCDLSMFENAWKEMDLQLLLVSSLKDGCFVLDTIGACIVDEKCERSKGFCRLAHFGAWKSMTYKACARFKRDSEPKCHQSFCFVQDLYMKTSPGSKGGLSCCMMFIVFRACRSSFSRFDLNWSSNLNKHFDFDLHVSVLDSFCMHLPSFSKLQIALGHSTSRTWSVFFHRGKTAPFCRTWNWPTRTIFLLSYNVEVEFEWVGYTCVYSVCVLWPYDLLSVQKDCVVHIWTGSLKGVR